MLQKIRKFTALIIVSILFSAIPTIARETQNRPQDRDIRQTIRFARGKHSAVISKQIKRGNSHTYVLRAREGQRMQVVLITRGRTSFTVYSPSEGLIQDADGVTDWVGDLTATGDYEITIGTDNTTNYTLEVAIK